MENKELSFRYRQLEQDLKEERDLLPAEFNVFKRELLTICKLPVESKKDRFGFFCDAFSKLADWLENELCPNNASLYKLSNLCELYAYERGQKPQSLVGKLFGPDLVRLKASLLKSSDCPDMLPVALLPETVKRSHKRKPDKKNERPIPQFKNELFKIEVIVLDSFQVRVAVKEKIGFQEIFLCNPKLNSLTPLSDPQSGLVVDLRQYYSNQNFKKEKDTGLILLAWPQEAQKLPLICFARFVDEYRITNEEELKEAKSPINVAFHYQEEFYASKIVRFEEEKALASHWNQYLKYLPMKGGIVETATKNNDKSQWKTRILETLQKIILG